MMQEKDLFMKDIILSEDEMVQVSGGAGGGAGGGAEGGSGCGIGCNGGDGEWCGVGCSSTSIDPIP